MADTKDPIAARKVQKADREKLRRDRLNEQFLELGKVLDPDRPKNDKGTILADTVQMLKDLTAQVNTLKAEYTTLSEESRELTQEKNELREEKASIKSDIDSLNAQYQQRVRVTFPWGAMDPTVMMGQPSYPYPIPLPVPTAPISMHPSLQPFPYFHNQNPTAIINPYPYSSPANPQIEQPSTHYGHPQASSRSDTSSKQDSKSKSWDPHRCRNVDKDADSSDVATELELKTPADQLSSAERKGKQSQKKQISCSSRCSSQGVQDSSSSSVAGPKLDN